MINEIEHEISILAALILDEGCEYVKPGDVVGIRWYNPQIESMAKECIRYRREGNAYDITLLHARLGSNTKRISDRISESMSALKINAQMYIYELKKQQAETELNQKIENGQPIGKEDIQRLISLNNNAKDERVHGFSDSVLRYLDILDMKISGKYEKYNTGILELDDKLGNIEPGALITIGGLSGLSKTNFALRIFTNMILKNVNCLYLSSEMSYNQLFDRIVAMTSGTDESTNLSAYNLKNGHITKEERRRVDDIIEKHFYKKENQYIVETSRFEMAKIEQHIERHKSKIVFVDFIQMFCDNEAENRSAAMSETARKLKELAMSTQTIVFALSQVNDKGQMKDSRGIDEKSDIVLTMIQTSDDDYGKEFDLLITKNRYGDNGKIPMRLNRKTCNIEPKRGI